EHLKNNRPPELREQIKFRELAKAPQVEGLIVYPTGTASIHVRQLFAAQSPSGRDTLSVYVWHPDGDPTALAPYEAWLWKELRRGLADKARKQGVELPPDPPFDADRQWLPAGGP